MGLHCPTEQAMRHIIGGSMLLGALADTSTADDKFQFLTESRG